MTVFSVREIFEYAKIHKLLNIIGIFKDDLFSLPGFRVNGKGAFHIDRVLKVVIPDNA